MGKTFLKNHLLWLTEESRMSYARNKLWATAANDLESLDWLYRTMAEDEPQQEFVLRVLQVHSARVVTGGGARDGCKMSSFWGGHRAVHGDCSLLAK